jgi:hypothetical protein
VLLRQDLGFKVQGLGFGPGFARYGPFWIATTLVFVSAVTGNYANWVTFRSKEAAAPPPPMAPGGGVMPHGSDKAWYYDINKVGGQCRDAIMKG